MAQVEGKFPDYSRFNNQGNFYLDADQAFNSYTWKPPINWSGTVNGINVKFVQISHSGSSKRDYDFTDFPQEVETAIGYIIEAIDEAMRVMD